MATLDYFPQLHAAVATCSAGRGHVGVGYSQNEHEAKQEAIVDLAQKHPDCERCKLLVLFT